MTQDPEPADDQAAPAKPSPTVPLRPDGWPDLLGRRPMSSGDRAKIRHALDAGLPGSALTRPGPVPVLPDHRRPRPRTGPPHRHPAPRPDPRSHPDRRRRTPDHLPRHRLRHHHRHPGPRRPRTHRPAPPRPRRTHHQARPDNPGPAPLATRCSRLLSASFRPHSPKTPVPGARRGLRAWRRGGPGGPGCPPAPEGFFATPA
jgi:hypothetical protein